MISKEDNKFFSNSVLDYAIVSMSCFYRVVAIVCLFAVIFMSALHFYEVKAENEEKYSQAHAALSAFFRSIESTLTHLDRRALLQGKEAVKDELKNIDSIPYDIPHEYKIEKFFDHEGLLDKKKLGAVPDN